MRKGLNNCREVVTRFSHLGLPFLLVFDAATMTGPAELLLRFLKLLKLCFMIVLLFINRVILTLIPPYQKLLVAIIRRNKSSSDEEINMRVESMKTNAALVGMWKIGWIKLLTAATYGAKATDFEILSLNNLQPIRMSDVAKAGRPLVINFGSCT